MDAKLKADWVKALRSGKYQQYNKGGIGGRESGSNELCCLGVGGRVAGLRAGLADKVLTIDCINALGISRQQGTRLADMNDGDGKTFAQIADWIEQNL